MLSLESNESFCTFICIRYLLANLHPYMDFFLGNRQTGNVYKNAKRKIERGIAFPTCVSVNNTVCHFSPLATDEAVLEENDMVKM